MSLGSVHPEKFDAALHASLARKLVDRLLPLHAWRYPGKDQAALEEEIVSALEQLSYADSVREIGLKIIYDYLIGEADSHDVLERLFESIGRGG